MTKKHAWNGVVLWKLLESDCLKNVGMALDGIVKKCWCVVVLHQQVGASRDLNCELEKWTEVCGLGLLSIDGDVFEIKATAGNTHF